VIWQNTKLLLRLYLRPLSATSAIIDEGSWLYAAVAVGVLSLLLQLTVLSYVYAGYEAVYRQLSPSEIAAAKEAIRSPATNGAERAFPGLPATDEAQTDEDEPSVPDFVLDRKPLPVVGNYGWWFISFAPGNFFSTLLGVALLFVPCLILIITLSEPIGSFGVVLRRDYGTLFTGTLMAWAAGHLPVIAAGLAIPRMGLGPRTALSLWCVSVVWFALLVALLVRTLFGVRFEKAVLLVSVSALAFAVQAKLFATVSPYLFSPFLLFYAYAMFRGDIGDIGFSLRQRQNFRRSMEAATINPRDAEAHYQLGLIFLQRRQYTEASERFKQAIEIDPTEIDAQYQMGRIARIQGRLQEALNYLSVVVDQDDKHNQHETWREIGLTYFAASMFPEARDAFERLNEHRPYDPEALFHYGKTLHQLGDSEQAREMFERCVEAVRTMPGYRQGQVRKWQKLAKQQLTARTQPA
jgi:tetratricopeptide (TPR) repeat protein